MRQAEKKRTLSSSLPVGPAFPVPPEPVTGSIVQLPLPPLLPKPFPTHRDHLTAQEGEAEAPCRPRKAPPASPPPQLPHHHAARSLMLGVGPGALASDRLTCPSPGTVFRAGSSRSGRRAGDGMVAHIPRDPSAGWEGKGSDIMIPSHQSGHYRVCSGVLAASRSVTSDIYYQSGTQKPQSTKGELK